MNWLVVAALWQGLTFTVPAGVTSYQARRSPDGGVSWYTAALYSRPDPQSPWPVPKLVGQRDTVRVSISTSAATWLAGGTVFQLIPTNANGQSVSNWIVIAAGPDTCWGLVRDSLQQFPWARRLIGPRPFAAMALGDTGRVRLEHGELTQLRDADLILEIYGYLPLRNRHYPTKEAAWPDGLPVLVP